MTITFLLTTHFVLLLTYSSVWSFGLNLFFFFSSMNEQMYGNAWHCAGGRGGCGFFFFFTKEFLCFYLFFFFPLRRRHDSEEVMDIINKSANKARRGEDTTQKKMKKSPRRVPICGVWKRGLNGCMD